MITKEELRKEADEYAEGMAKYYASTHEDCIPSQFEKYLRNAYISSAEPREKRIADLESQIKQLTQQLELLKPYRCKAHYVVSDSGRAMECWKAVNCNGCRFFKE